MCPSAPRVCNEPGGQKPVLSLSLDLITASDGADMTAQMEANSMQQQAQDVYWLQPPQHLPLDQQMWFPGPQLVQQPAGALGPGCCHHGFGHVENDKGCATATAAYGFHWLYT